MEHVSGSKSYGMADFDSFYADFGFNQAFEKDSNSFSYVVNAAPGLWIMALDIANSSLPMHQASGLPPRGQSITTRRFTAKP